MRIKIRRGVVGTAAAALIALGGAYPLTASPLSELTKSAPGIRTYDQDGRILRLYGTPMSHGGDFYRSGEIFLRDHADVFGLRPENFVLMKQADGLDFQPLMLDRETGKYEFVGLHYQQIHEGMEVYGGELTLLFRNEPGFPMVEAVSNLKSVASVEVPRNGFIAPGAIGARGYQPDNQQMVRKVIYFDPNNGEGDVPTVAYTYVVTVGQIGDDIAVGIDGSQREGRYDRRRVFVDALTGALLYSESLIRAVDVTGNVSGWSTPGLLPDTSTNPPVIQVLPRVFVQILGGNQGETDQTGDYVIAHGGSGDVTVRSRMVGPSLSQGVVDQAGSEILVDQVVTPPGPADFVHNPGQTAFDTAEVNAMLRVSEIHTFLGLINPNYPSLNRSFFSNVNIASTCNAFYDGSSVNFFQAGGGCVNTAYSTVVYHEYGHKIVDDGASAPSGDYHEGMADSISQILTDDPVVGRGFSGQGTMVRTGDNNRQYPCNGEVHFCGQVVSGCVWHTRDELLKTEPVEYLNIIRDLTINSILLHSGGVDPGITIDFLVLDDDDNDIANGTPHYNEINAGFSRHNMPAPPVQFLDFGYPNGQPSMIDPGGGTVMRVEVTGNVSEPKPGSGMLHVNDGNGWVDLSMTDLGNNVYDAVFPAVDCPSVVQYYVSAETVDGDLVTDPAGAPNSTFSTIGATNVADILLDDFETDQGWTTENIQIQDGAWERGVPVGGGSRGDPAKDFDGSGRCYLTGNRAGNSDVDGGPTRLISPTFNMSGVDGFVNYARWFTNDDNDQDRMTVEISNDGGSNWTVVRSIGNQQGWQTDSFKVSDFVNPTANMQVRFSATDNPNDSVTEGAIDAVRIVSASCGAPGGMLLTVDPLVAGQNSRFTAEQATVGQRVYFTYSVKGLGDTFVPRLNVTLGILNPKLAGSAKANSVGIAALIRKVPGNTSGTEVWVQAAEQGRISNIVNQVIQ